MFFNLNDKYYIVYNLPNNPNNGIYYFEGMSIPKKVLNLLHDAEKIYRETIIGEKTCIQLFSQNRDCKEKLNEDELKYFTWVKLSARAISN
jgi:hypothetical protein